MSAATRLLSVARQLLGRFSHSIWLAAYDLEESRAAHAAQGRYLRSACCCVGLAVLVLLRRG